MKNALANRIFRRVSITHGIVILLTILLPLARCARKPKDVVTFFDLAGAPPPPATSFEPKDVPEPEVKSSRPEQKPTARKKPALEPVATNIPPKKAEPKKPAATNTPPKKAETNAPTKPKTEAEKLAEIRKGGKRVVNQTVPASAIRRQPDLSSLRAALNSAASGSASEYGTGTAASGTGSGSGGGMYSPFAGYYDSVKQQMYAVWQQPVGAPIGLTATASIRVERNGTVSLKSITRRSGNAQFDESVQKALNATIRLPMPPPDLPDRNISIEFVLSD